MFDTDTETQDRGQVGIGTLIVFIALVLVAAIAAGVLINTAGFLQSQAESTGQESTAQVANNLDATIVSGTTADPSDGDPGVQTIELTVQLAPGSNPIDLTQTTVEVYAEDQSRATVAGSNFADASLNSGETSTLTFPDDTVFGTIASADGTGTVGALPEGNSAEIVIVTADGSQTETVITAPDPITNTGEEVILD